MVEAKRIDDENGLIVQLPLSSFWGDDEEYDVRNKLAEALEQFFLQDGCGVFDGTDIGEAKTNLFVYHINDQDWDRAVTLALGELERRSLLDKAIVARSVAVGEPDGPWAEHTVVWPKDFRGRFCV